METYLKAPPKPPRRRPKKVVGVFSFLLSVFGVLLIFQAAWPVMGWYFFVMPGIGEKIISPLATTLAPLVRAQETEESYYPTKIPVVASQLKSYTLSIPKLKINEATVQIGGDLKKSLVAWPTSALPGTWGNNIIFGHSELPQFASPNSYSGMFTHLFAPLVLSIAVFHCSHGSNNQSKDNNSNY